MHLMWRFLIMALLLAACATAGVTVGDGAYCTMVPLPVNAREAQKVRLVLEDVTVPGNQPLKLRVTTLVDGHEILLGSVGIEAVSRSAKGTRSLPSLVIDVTRGLHRLLAKDGNAMSVNICATAVDGRNRPLQDVSWSVRSMRLAVPSE